MSLTLTIDRPYPFDILFYERKDPSELLCLILRPEGQFMLLKKDDVSGLWQHLSGNNDDQAFEQAILEQARNLVPYMLAVTAIRPWQDLEVKFR